MPTQKSIRSIAQETLHKEAQAILSQKEALDNNFDAAVEVILESKRKLIVTGMGNQVLLVTKLPPLWQALVRPLFSSSC